MLEGSMSLLPLLESNQQLLTYRAALGPRFMLNLPTHPRTPSCPRGGLSGLGAADSLSLLSAQDFCLGMND